MSTPNKLRLYGLTSALALATFGCPTTNEPEPPKPAQDMTGLVDMGADQGDLQDPPDQTTAQLSCEVIKKTPARFELTADSPQQLMLELRCNAPLELSCADASCAALRRGEELIPLNLFERDAADGSISYVASIPELTPPAQPGQEAVFITLPGLAQPLREVLRWGIPLDALTQAPLAAPYSQQLPEFLSQRRVLGLRLLDLEQPLDPSQASRAPMIALVSSEDGQRVELWAQDSEEDAARLLHTLPAPAMTLTNNLLHITPDRVTWLGADPAKGKLVGLSAQLDDALKLVSAKALTSAEGALLKPGVDQLIFNAQKDPQLFSLGFKDASTLVISKIADNLETQATELKTLAGVEVSALTPQTVGLLEVDDAGQPVLWFVNKTQLVIASPQLAQPIATIELNATLVQPIIERIIDPSTSATALVLMDRATALLTQRDALGQWSAPLKLQLPKHVTITPRGPDEPILTSSGKLKLLGQTLVGLGAGPGDARASYAITWDLSSGKLLQVNQLQADLEPRSATHPALITALDRPMSLASAITTGCELHADPARCLARGRCVQSSPPDLRDAGLCLTGGTAGLRVVSARAPSGSDQAQPEAASLGQGLWISMSHPAQSLQQGLSITVNATHDQDKSTHTLWTLDAQGALAPPTALSFEPAQRGRALGALSLNAQQWAIMLQEGEDKLTVGTFKTPEPTQGATITMPLQVSPHPITLATTTPRASGPPMIVLASQLTLNAPRPSQSADLKPSSWPTGSITPATPLLIAHTGAGCGALEIIALEGLEGDAPKAPRTLAKLDEATSCEEQPTLIGMGRFFDEDGLSIVTYHPKTRAVRLSHLQQDGERLTLVSRQVSALEAATHPELIEAGIGDWSGDGLDGIALKNRGTTALVLIAHSGEGNLADYLRPSSQPPASYQGVRAGATRQAEPSAPLLNASFSPPSPPPTTSTSGTHGWLAVSAGGTHTCAIKLDQTIQCWGASDSTSGVPTGTFTQINAGENHDCAIRTDGTVACWGLNNYGQATAPQGTFKQVAAGVEFSCGVRSDDSITCWGLNDGGQIPTGTFKEVQTHSGNACAKRTDDTLVCWDWNATTPAGPHLSFDLGTSSGACGLDAAGQISCWGGGFLSMQTPAAGAFTQLTTGDFHSCARRADGSIGCFGANNYGQSTPPQGNFVYVTGGRFHTCVLGVDQQITCWGDDSGGQSTVPIPPPDVWVDVGGGSGYSCGLRTSGALRCWGNNTQGRATPPAGAFSAISSSTNGSCAIRSADQTVACWGNQHAYLPLSAPAGQFTQLSIGGASHSCGIKTDGSVFCWGQNNFGQITTPAGTFTQISAGGLHTCGLRADGTIACWGQSQQGSLAAPMGTFTKVRSGRVYHNCAIRTDGTLACWGSNSYGQASPPSGQFIDVTVNEYSSCGIRADGSAVCWGQSYAGINSPPAGPFVKINSGPFHACAVRADGSAACWGTNAVGECQVPQ